MIIEYTKDEKEIKSVLFDESIWDRIREDGQTRDTFSLPPDNEWIWSLFKDNGNVIGAFCVHPLNNTTIQVHIHVIDKYRKSHAKDCGDMIIYWFANESPENIQKMNAVIPVIYQDVYIYTKKFGFIDEGINRKSFTKGGNIHDQHCLGITREEAIEWEQQRQ